MQVDFRSAGWPVAACRWLALVGLAFFFVVGTTAQAGLVVTEVMSSSAHPSGAVNGDWWELTNNGPASLLLDGYSWDDDSVTPGTSTFPSGITIAAGESIVIVDESLANLAAWKTAWNVGGSVQVLSSAQFGGSYAGFSSGGDAVEVYDVEDDLVASASIPPATQGFTFEWDSNGNSRGLSVIGENGAYQALDNGVGGAGVDVGSPGVVPEPSTLWLTAMGVASLAVVSLRRRKSNR